MCSCKPEEAEERKKRARKEQEEMDGERKGGQGKEMRGGDGVNMRVRAQ